MMDILQKISQNKRRELKANFSNENKAIEKFIGSLSSSVCSLKNSLIANPPGIIAEFKRRSPSKGDIFPMADVNEIIPDYCKNGAGAISVLTDTRFFGGAATDLSLAVSVSSVPVLRKDFIISELQIAEARHLGASAVLLIAAMLSKEELSRFYRFAHELGLEVLVEIHDQTDMEKIDFIPDMLGVNNRDLTTFTTDMENSLRLLSSLPKECFLVAESGIKRPADLKRLREAGYNGFLIGEALMASESPGRTLKRFVDE